ncbi:MAG: FHA domain-containing protein [Lachnospiraceae bacterium]|nr:FHA domain-containing protein [Lachnospiraceae bacterium]
MKNKDHAYYLLILIDGHISTYSLSSKDCFLLGRKTAHTMPDIDLKAGYVSREHGKLIKTENGWSFQEMGSTNGTYLNGHKVQYEENDCPIVLADGDVLTICKSADIQEQVWIYFTKWQLQPVWVKYSLAEEKTVRIGRDHDNDDVVLENECVSRTHAILFLDSDGNCTLRDNDSMNGVIVNKRTIRGSCVLKNMDVIHLTDCTMVYTKDYLYYEEPQQWKNASKGKYILQAHIHSKKVVDRNGGGQKELIRDVKVNIEEGSLVALLGGSGAGKTTVMNCLNGMDTVGMEGSVLFYGEDLIAGFHRLKYLIGSVPQKEVFHEMLTVEEELKEAAILRLPSGTPKKEVESRIDRTIHQLGLEHVRKNRISLCSGGEKRRVNIAIDLVADRKLLCLDEPDAGLDPGMKQELFSILRKLTREEGKSILVIIHDVSELQYFDQIIMMTKLNNVGRLAFAGSPKEAEQYFGTTIKDAYSLLDGNPEKYIQ